jgi:hypothetical protein
MITRIQGNGVTLPSVKTTVPRPVLPTGRVINKFVSGEPGAVHHLHDRAKRARFTTIIKNKFDAWCRQVAFNETRRMKILSRRAA